jgi:hypothetical protein
MSFKGTRDFKSSNHRHHHSNRRLLFHNLVSILSLQTAYIYILSPQAAAWRARLVSGEELLERDAKQGDGATSQALQVYRFCGNTELVEQYNPSIHPSIRHLLLLQLAHKAI